MLFRLPHTPLNADAMPCMEASKIFGKHVLICRLASPTAGEGVPAELLQRTQDLVAAGCAQCQRAVRAGGVKVPVVTTLTDLYHGWRQLASWHVCSALSTVPPEN